MQERFNVNFNVNFNILLEKFICAFSWINKKLDNTNIHGNNCEKNTTETFSANGTFS
jgi:hypothetical protein